jgi:hypothetical protein
MATTHVMRCPHCGIVMNYHAEKINYLAAPTNPEAIDPDLRGIVEEVYTYPGCGNTETRRAEGAEEGSV